MTNTPNPYASPVADSDIVPDVYSLPTRGARVGNMILDYIAIYFFSGLVGFAMAMFLDESVFEKLEGPWGTVYGYVIMFVYFFATESLTSRTFGKLLTGTQVVNADGGRPTPGQIAGRTLCRLIPFEAFSFLGKETRGWHDVWPNTYVVRVR